MIYVTDNTHGKTDFNELRIDVRHTNKPLARSDDKITGEKCGVLRKKIPFAGEQRAFLYRFPVKKGKRKEVTAIEE